jgi:hypothetical protein
MLPGALVVCLGTVMLAVSAGAETFFSWQSEPGDPVGQGMPLFIGAADADFLPQVWGTGGVRIVVRSPPGPDGRSQFHNFIVEPPAGRNLVRGPYDGASLFDFTQVTVPGLHVTGSEGCEALAEGRFVVHEVEIAGASVVRFAADAEQRCLGSDGLLHASVRFNASPTFPPPPESDGDGVPDSLDNCIDVPNLDQLDADKDALGDACDQAFTRTFFATNGPSVDALGNLQPTTERFPTDSQFLPLPLAWPVSETVRVRILGDGNDDLRFSPPLNQPLVPGLYEGADEDLNADGPALESSRGTCDDADRRFEVLEVERGPNGEVERFAADFAFLCATPIIGGMRINASEAVSGPFDSDGDGLLDPTDNCPAVANDQADADGDGRGDACDEELGASFVLLDSPPGEPIGRGMRLLTTRASAPFRPSRNLWNGIDVRFENEVGSDFSVSISLPGRAEPAPGLYEGATRHPSTQPDEPGLSVSGGHVGCSAHDSRFEIFEFATTPLGAIKSISFDFEQACRLGNFPPLSGSVRYRASFRPVPGDGDGDGLLDEEDGCPDHPDPTQADADGNGVGDVCQLLEVAIDVRPGLPVNLVNPMSRGVIPVAVLGADDFDVADVDPETLAFGPAGAPATDRPRSRSKDVNRDGLTDLLVFFRAEESGIAFGDTEACVRGETLDGESFRGCDTIRTVPGCGLGFEGAVVTLPLASWLRRRRKRLA